MESKADEMFRKLGYSLEESCDEIIEYRKQLLTCNKFIRFNIRDKEFTVLYYIDDTQAYFSVQELQAINEKVKELEWIK